MLNGRPGGGRTHDHSIKSRIQPTDLKGEALDVSLSVHGPESLGFAAQSNGSATVQAPAKKRTRAHVRGFPCTPMVYFVQARTLGFIKIGVTVDIDDRINGIQVGCPDHVELIGGIADRRAYHLERALHARFDADRHRGEWFRPSEELLAFIARWPMSRVEEKRNFEILLALGGPARRKRSA